MESLIEIHPSFEKRGRRRDFKKGDIILLPFIKGGWEGFLFV